MSLSLNDGSHFNSLLHCLLFTQDIKADVTKSDKSAATSATTKQNGLDIASITTDGCELSLTYMHIRIFIISVRKMLMSSGY